MLVAPTGVGGTLQMLAIMLLLCLSPMFTWLAHEGFQSNQNIIKWGKGLKLWRRIITRIGSLLQPFLPGDFGGSQLMLKRFRESTGLRKRWHYQWSVVVIFSFGFTSRIHPSFLGWVECHCHLLLWQQSLCKKMWIYNLWVYLNSRKEVLRIKRRVCIVTHLPSCNSLLALTMGNTSTCFSFSCHLLNQTQTSKIIRIQSF